MNAQDMRHYEFGQPGGTRPELTQSPKVESVFVTVKINARFGSYLQFWYW